MAAPKQPSVTLRRRTLSLENSKWRVFRDDITGADGTEVDGFIVVAPVTARPDHIGGVSVLPVLPDGRVGLCWNYRHPLDLYSWEVPRGFIDPGETDLGNAALRELMEEAGLACDRDRLISVGTVAQEASTLAVKGALFVALDCRFEAKPDHSEPGLGELVFHTLEDALKLAERGEIQDAATLITLYRFALSPHRI
jgi:ADP-ribose pyrophosphatase